jgi:signal recognition particle receptor subunit alpha
MLDRFVVFTRAGVVLWDHTDPESPTDPGAAVSALIQEVLLAGSRDGRQALSVSSTNQRVKCVETPDRGLVFAAVYSAGFASMMTYVDVLLPAVERRFLKLFLEPAEAQGRELLRGVGWGVGKLDTTRAGMSAMAAAGAFDAFGPVYEQLLAKAEEGAAAPPGLKSGSKVGGPGNSAPTLPTVIGTAAVAEDGSLYLVSEKNPALRGGKENAGDGGASTDEGEGGSGTGTGGDDDDGDGDDDDSDDFDGGAPLPPGSPLRFAARGGRGGRGGSARGGGSASSSGGRGKQGGGVVTPSPGGGKGGKGGASSSKEKEKRSWGDSYNASLAAELDKSKPSAAAAASPQPAITFSGTGASGSGRDLVADSDLDDDLRAAVSGGSVAAQASSSSSKGVAGWLSRTALGSWVSSVAGSKTLARADLEPVADSLRTHLMAKNVATEVADELCAALVAKLEGTTLEAGSATSSVASKIEAAAVRALRESIERILTPRRPVDVLRDVKAKMAAQQGRPAGARDPFVVVFCGVNGVGKSTTLAKTTYHLKDNGHSVLIAACDSFRSGAVEQLERHCGALGVPLYERGYKKNPADIASGAVVQAKADGIDVVLVDTAGRMQNNRPLMQQLAELVASTRPDLVLFVGEALVGNDGVDQLQEFSRSLVDQAVDAKNPRRIDGIVLTKFDTVDDKVGAALSMVHRTGIPVVFLGVGQQYQDLRKLNVAAVVRALLAP